MNRICANRLGVILFGVLILLHGCNRDENKLELLVRSHEMKMEGYEVEAEGRVITVFSAPNYCDQMKNKGAFIRFKGKEMKPMVKTFDWVVISLVLFLFFYRIFFYDFEGFF